MLTFADGRSEESFSRSSGIAKGSKKGVEENAICVARKDNLKFVEPAEVT